MYKIVIPSFKRSDIIQTHTLKSLLMTDFDAEIYVFVANDEEKAIYQKALGSYSNIKVVTGVRGIPNQRNFIQRYFPVGERLFFIDDDIKTIVGLNKEGKRVTARKLHQFIEQAFDVADKMNLKMWGINSTNSNLEMKHKVSVGLIYLVGNFYGLINTHDVFVDEGDKIKTRLNYKAGKESHERALLMYRKYGGVLKFRSFGVVSEYWGVPGGHQVSRTVEGEHEAAQYLHKLFPDITELRTYKDIPDLVIKPQTKVFDFKFTQ